MVRRFLPALAAVAILSGGASAALARDGQHAPPAGALTLAQAVEKLAAEGKEVREIKFRDGMYVVDIAAGGHKTTRAAFDPVNLQQNPEAFAHWGSGIDRAPAHSLPAVEVVHKLQQAGYQIITAMDIHPHHWKIHALTTSGERVRLDVDAVTGAITTPRHEKIAKELKHAL